MKNKILLVLLAVLITGTLWCGGEPESTTEYREITTDDLRKLQKDQAISKGKRFVVETLIWRYSEWNSEISIGLVHDLSVKDLKEDLLKERIETDKVYRIYLTAIPYYNSYAGETFSVDRIEGLMPLEEAQARIAQRNAEKEKAEAEREAKEEAERQAYELANRYDPSKFIIVPSGFKPADYDKADLFYAVAASEKLDYRHTYWFDADLGPPSRKFVSDVVFVSQNGTDITFRTEDNAIRKTMKVGSRTGLTAGQKVRIYYRAYNLQDWQIVAIERL
jgi:hypothetical protein